MGSRVVVGMGLWVCWMLGASIGVHAAESAQDTRARLSAGERQARLRFEQQRQVCYGQFLVEACVERAREQLRADVQAIRAERVEIDAQRRQERAQQRRARVDAKAVQMRAPAASAANGHRLTGRTASPMASVSRHGEGAAAGPTPAAGSAPSVAATDKDDGGAARAAQQDRQRERAARSAQAQARRASAAQAHRESVTQREAQRARDKPAIAPLPVPAASR